MTDSAGDWAAWDFFVSYTQEDRAWAEWIAWLLEADGYRVLIQAWDMVAGSNWIGHMDQGVQRAARTVAVVSPAYLSSVYGTAEWQAAWADDPQGLQRKLIMVRVRGDRSPGLLAGVVCIDLVGRSETAARQQLLDDVAAAVRGRLKPGAPPPFPRRVIEPKFPPSAQGAASSEHKTQINSLYAESPSVVWPHQVGSVPLLADSFQQRERENARLEEAVTTGRAGLTQVLSGLGGVGKTQLAASYAQRVWARGEVSLLVWVTAASRAAVQATYAQAAAEIGQLPAGDVERAAEWFLRWLQTTNRRWLVVLDDVADPADLRGLWPTGDLGRTVITTRRRDAVLTDRGRRLIDVGLYTKAEAVSYLQDKLGAGGPKVISQAAELTADLGRLPLALAQAASFIRDRRETCAGYRRRLGDRRRRLSEILSEDALADDYRATVAATWSISVDRADALSPVGLARPMLQLVSTLDPNGVPLEVVTTLAARTVIAEQRAFSVSDGSLAVDEQDCEYALNNLHRLNLISLDPSSGARAIRTHALVQRATLERLSTDALSTTVRAAADALVQVWPGIERDTDLSRVLRDCASSLRERHGELLWDLGGHAVLFRAGRSLGECGLVGAAVGYWTEMVTHAKAVLGADHPRTLMARRNRARWLGQAGQATGAAAEFEAMLPDHLRVLGQDHPHTLATRHGLAWWRGEAGDKAGAVADLVALRDDLIRILGPDHLNTLTTRFSLGRWLGQAGKPTDALAEFKALLSDSRRLMGADHLLTLEVRHDQAWWLGEAGEPAASIGEFEALLKDRLRTMGPDHPHTLATRHDLAWWRGKAGDTAGAATALEALLADYLRVMGPDHPHTLATRDDLDLCRSNMDVQRVGRLRGQVINSTNRDFGDLPGLGFQQLDDLR